MKLKITEVYNGGRDSSIRCTLKEFVKTNRTVISRSEMNELQAAVAAGETYCLGGGRSYWLIKRAA
jgi:hypothetical protein